MLAGDGGSALRYGPGMAKTAAADTSAPGRWRKRRLVIEAVRYDGTSESFQLIAQWSANAVRHDPASGMPVVWSPEGPKYCNEGDWVIRGVLGEYYPVQAAVFEATYEPAEAADHGALVLTTQQVRGIVASARNADPAALRELVETLAFSHETLRGREST